jgi:hypothetical protein
MGELSSKELVPLPKPASVDDIAFAIICDLLDATLAIVAPHVVRVNPIGLTEQPITRASSRNVAFAGALNEESRPQRSVASSAPVDIGAGPMTEALTCCASLRGIVGRASNGTTLASAIAGWAATAAPSCPIRTIDTRVENLINGGRWSSTFTDAQ